MNMTNEQKTLFLRALSTGIACGLNHRYEAFTNYMRFLPQILPYDSVANAENDLIDAFIAFEKNTASCEEETQELEKLDRNGYMKLVNEWYNRKRDLHTKKNRV